MQELIKRFADDVRFGCHNVQTEVSRSEAGKELLKKADEALPAVTTFLEALPAPEGKIELNVQVGITMLMNDLGNKLNRTVPTELAYSDRAGWIAWAKQKLN